MVFGRWRATLTQPTKKLFRLFFGGGWTTQLSFQRHFHWLRAARLQIMQSTDCRPYTPYNYSALT